MNQQILAKALVGKGKLSYHLSKKIAFPSSISKALGCWIINLRFEPIFDKNQAFLKGEYDIQLWYALDQNQKSEVHIEKVEFFERVNMAYRSVNVVDEENLPKVYVNKYPSCTSMILQGSEVNVEIEAVFYMDIFKDSIIVVETKEEEDTFSLNEEIEMNVNTNYIEKKQNKRIN